MLPKPYHSEHAVTIFCGDCRQIVPLLGRFDLLLTDPPYGIGLNTSRIRRTWNVKSSKWAAARVTKDYGVHEWDSAPPPDDLINMVVAAAGRSIIWGGNYFALPPSPFWLVWDKQTSGNFADAELAWTNMVGAVKLKHYLWNGFKKAKPEDRWHPTQKPLEVIQWALSLAGNIQTILDPFAGSGTTGVAAKNLGKTAVLIEREERYCEIAAKRLAQGVLNFDSLPQRNGSPSFVL
jgi:DNA modification methylase